MGHPFQAGPAPLDRAVEEAASALAGRGPEVTIFQEDRLDWWLDKELVTLRVDCRDSVWVKFGFIFRLLKGSRGHMERRKIDGEAWLPTYSRFTGSGRVFFIARVDLDHESEFSGYRRIEPVT